MKFHRLGLGAFLLLSACVSRQQEHFYVLDAQPMAPATARSQFDRQVTLQVTVPSMVDRGEMVLTTPSGVAVLDHERWAAPLADLVTATLSQDIERRRSDAVVLPRSADHSGLPLIRMTIAIDRIAASLGDPMIIEAHWRISRAGQETLGRDTFVSPLKPQSYSQIAAALSTCIALLADRLAAEIPSG